MRHGKNNFGKYPKPDALLGRRIVRLISSVPISFRVRSRSSESLWAEPGVPLGPGFKSGAHHPKVMLGQPSGQGHAGHLANADCYPTPFPVDPLGLRVR